MPSLKTKFNNTSCRTLCAQSLSPVWLFCDPMDCIPPGSSAHGIFQARILDRVAISFSGRTLYTYANICVFFKMYTYIIVYASRWPWGHWISVFPWEKKKFCLTWLLIKGFWPFCQGLQVAVRSTTAIPIHNPQSLFPAGHSSLSVQLEPCLNS